MKTMQETETEQAVSHTPRFTPGPLKAQGADIFDTCNDLPIGKAFHIFYRRGDQPIISPEANACLWAASPELLSACNWAMSQLARFRSADATDQVQQHWDQESEEVMGRLSAAIAKAEGRV